MNKYIRAYSALIIPLLLVLVSYVFFSKEYASIPVDCNSDTMTKVVKTLSIEDGLRQKFRGQLEHPISERDCRFLLNRYCAEGLQDLFIQNSLLCIAIEQGLDIKNADNTISVLFNKKEISFLVFLGLIPMLIFFFILVQTENGSTNTDKNEAKKDIEVIGLYFIVASSLFFLAITLENVAFSPHLQDHYTIAGTIFGLTFVLCYRKLQQYLSRFDIEIHSLPNSGF